MSQQEHFTKSYSQNNDGIFGNVKFIDPSTVDLMNPNNGIDYIVTDCEYALSDFSVFHQREKLWLLIGEPYQYPVKLYFHNRDEFGKVI